MKTDTFAILPVLGCLTAIESFLKKKDGWDPVIDEQVEFLSKFHQSYGLVSELEDCLKVKADTSVKVINQFLTDNGFSDLQLDENNGGEFSVASVLNLLCEWKEEATEATVTSGDNHYPGVRITKGFSVVRDEAIHPNPIVKLETKSGDTVCMTVCDKLSETQYSLHEKIEELKLITASYTCDGTIFPMVDYEADIDISYLVGMKIRSTDYFIGQAIQKTRFKMNEFGAKAESIAAITLCRSCITISNPWIVIDKPFLLWIERDGIDLPLFIGLFCEDVWKNPGGLT